MVKEIFGSSVAIFLWNAFPCFYRNHFECLGGSFFGGRAVRFLGFPPSPSQEQEDRSGFRREYSYKFRNYWRCSWQSLSRMWSWPECTKQSESQCLTSSHCTLKTLGNQFLANQTKKFIAIARWGITPPHSLVVKNPRPFSFLEIPLKFPFVFLKFPLQSPSIP